MLLTTTTTMALQRAFLVSNFELGIQKGEVRPLFEHAVQARPSAKFLYIPTAMYALKASSARSPGQQRQRARRDARQRRDRIVETLREIRAENDDVQVATLDLYDGSLKHKSHGTWPRTDVEAIETADVICVEGGNTFWLWSCMEKYAKKLKDSNALYVGVSAGAIVFGRHVSTALWKGWDDPNVVQPPRKWRLVRGLDLANGASFFPHFTDEFAGLVESNEESLRGSDLVLIDEAGSCTLAEGTSRESAFDLFLEEEEATTKKDQSPNKRTFDGTVFRGPLLEPPPEPPKKQARIVSIEDGALSRRSSSSSFSLHQEDDDDDDD
mmetsp:Transcript_12550/g.41070  ORF Transcript_12550/g.41070 Transcript_12550/m.41070 type:complete len:325 (-) Transcript_12550:66-1040(-)